MKYLFIVLLNPTITTCKVVKSRFTGCMFTTGWAPIFIHSLRIITTKGAKLSIANCWETLVYTLLILPIQLFNSGLVFTFPIVRGKVINAFICHKKSWQNHKNKVMSVYGKGNCTQQCANFNRETYHCRGDYSRNPFSRGFDEVKFNKAAKLIKELGRFLP